MENEVRCVEVDVPEYLDEVQRIQDSGQKVVGYDEITKLRIGVLDTATNIAYLFKLSSIKRRQYKHEAIEMIEYSGEALKRAVHFNKLIMGFKWDEYFESITQHMSEEAKKKVAIFANTGNGLERIDPNKTENKNE